MTLSAAVHLFLGLLWAQLALALAPTWQAGTYYSYGWLVLAATVFFYFNRRRDFPPAPARPWPPAKFVPLALLLLLVLLAVAALRIIEGANPFWRLVLWAQALLTLLATASLLAFSDGFKAMRRYLPALVLILSAVPLPSTVERLLVGNLTHAVVLASSDLARASGIPLEVAETAFIIRGQPLDVNDRCSGIRSFQSSVAVALIAGELLRLALPARLALLLLGCLASFVGNLFRVLSLVSAFFHGGLEGMEARHDMAGMLSVSLTYAAILAAGFLLDHLASRIRKAGPSRETPARTELQNLSP